MASGDGNSNFRSEIREALVYILLGGLIMIFSVIQALIKKGYEESFVKGTPITFGTYLATFTTYIPLLIVAFLCVIFPMFRLFALGRDEDPAMESKPTWVRIFSVTYIHAPEENGLLYFLSEEAGRKGDKNVFRWFRNPLKLLLASIFLFGIFGLLVLSNPQLAVADVPPSSLQQITIGSEIGFGSLIPAYAENGTILAIFMIIMGINAYLCALLPIEKRYRKYLYFLFGFIICVAFMGFLWSGMHNIVYENSAIDKQNTLIFGIVGSLLTLLTGSFIPWFIWHIMNNLYIYLGELIELKSDVYFITIAILVIMFLVWLFRMIYKIKHKIREVYTVPEA